MELEFVRMFNKFIHVGIFFMYSIIAALWWCFFFFFFFFFFFLGGVGGWGAQHLKPLGGEVF